VTSLNYLTTNSISSLFSFITLTSLITSIIYALSLKIKVSTLLSDKIPVLLAIVLLLLLFKATGTSNLPPYIPIFSLYVLDLKTVDLILFYFSLFSFFYFSYLYLFLFIFSKVILHMTITNITSTVKYEKYHKQVTCYCYYHNIT